MVNELHLSGNELVCYAIIYGFSQDGKFWDGSLTYLSEWLGSSRRTAINVINSLITKGYIEKQDYEVNNVKFCKYRAIAPNFIGSEKIALGGSENFSPCINNSIYIKKEERDKSLSKKDELFEECWKAYRRKGRKNLAQTQWRKLNDDERQRVIRHVEVYVSSREINYQQDFERYLRDKTFNTIVVKDNRVIFDPTCQTEADYHPWGNTRIMWNPKFNCWLSIDDFNGSVIDGYNDDNRPDGAQIVLHNARGTITWSKKDKKWNIEMKSPW